MEFNSGFKGLMVKVQATVYSVTGYVLDIAKA